MEFFILTIVAILAFAYIFSFFRKGLKGDCACKSGTCNADCKSKKCCKDKEDTP